MMCTLPDYILREFHENIDKVTALCSSAHFDLVGVVGWCEGVVYLTSPGRPTDIGLQLGKACYPCSR